MSLSWTPADFLCGLIESRHHPGQPRAESSQPQNPNDREPARDAEKIASSNTTPPKNGIGWHQVCSGLQSVRLYKEAGESLEQTLHAQRNLSIAIDDIAPDEKTPRQREKSAATDSSSTRPAEDPKVRDYNLLLSLGHIQERHEAPGPNDPIIVRFTSSEQPDPFNPQTFSPSRKFLYTLLVGLVALITSGAAAFESGINPQASEELHVPQIIELLSTAVYMISFGLGTLISAPFSETLGRNPIYLSGLLFFMVWTLGAALAPNVQTQLVMRFFMGLFGSPPAVTFGGSISDLYTPLERVYVFPILSFLTFLGPFLAPVVASYIATSPLAGVSWHFVEWLTLILSAATFVGIAAFSRETYAPVLLAWKARHLRRITGDERYKAPVEVEGTSLAWSLLYSLKRPWVFLFKETIVALFALYLIVIYIVLFGSLVAYNYIFGRTGEAIYFLSQREVGLCYLPLNFGFLLAMAPLPWLYSKYKTKLAASRERGVERLQPEEHLWFAMLGAPFLPISLLWIGLSAKPDVSYWSPLIASVFFGASSLAIFITCYQYIIDSYEEFAASALVGMTFTRYVASAPIVVAADYMYSSMGVRNAELVWFAVSAAMCVVPYLFYWYGPYIRSKSRRATDFGTDYGKPHPKKAVLQKIRN